MAELKTKPNKADAEAFLNSMPNENKHPFFWISVISLGISIVLARLNIYLGARVNYLDYLSFFNILTFAMMIFVGVAILLSMTGLWRVRFRSIPLVLMSLASSAFLILLFLID